jgi:hypothetical protein
MQWMPGGGMQRCVCILFAHGHGQDTFEGGGGSHYYNRIKDRDMFSRKRFFFQYLFFGACFYLVWDVGWDRMLIWARLHSPPLVKCLHQSVRNTRKGLCYLAR